MRYFTFIIATTIALAKEETVEKKILELNPIVVESSPLGSKVTELTQAWSVLDKIELGKTKSSTIAETLANQPGINQSFFGPGSNRTIIRGLDRYRVRILQNGVDSFDVSSTSEDHAVSVDPMFIERIEVLRGSSALLHGGSAIGGVVNVINRNIPIRPFANSSGGTLRSSYTSVNQGWNHGVIGYGGTDSMSFQVNGLKRDFDEYESPIGKVVNSNGKSSSFGLGGSRFWENGYAGLSFSQSENIYGVPGEHAENETQVELESDRLEARSEFEVLGSDWLRSIEFNFGYGDYRHDEIGRHHEEEEDDHEGEEEEEHESEFETHATYFREGMEGRVAFVHEIGELRGVLGFHGLFDELRVQGEDNIFGGESGTNGAITAEDSTKLALFLIEEFNLSESTRVNGGIRWESHDRDFEGIPDRDDSSFSASGGFSRELSERWLFSGNLSYTERSPETAELFSDGPHHATESFEIGNPLLDNETAVGVEVILRRTLGKVTGQISGFHTQFNHYIFLEDTGNERTVEGEDLPERKYEAAKAEFRGLEAEIDWLALENPGWSLLLSAQGDLVRARNETEGTNLPRIPPARLGAGFEIQAEKLTFGMNLNRVFKQDRISEHEEEEGGDHDHGETATAAYSLLNAYASYDLNIGDHKGEIFIRGRNLTDELARVHTSFLKSSAPLPGRSFEIGLMMEF